MSSRPELVLDWCSHRAAQYAVSHWHYSGRLPMPPMVRVGVWEEGCFLGCVLFSRGACPTLGRPYGLAMTQVVELTRIALREHVAPVTRIVAIALKKFRQNSPGTRLVLSFADPAEGHVGTVYQAGNWVYLGETKPELQFHDGARWLHRREAVSKTAFNAPKRQLDWRQMPQRLMPGKYRYGMPLDPGMRDRLATLAKPYPKRVRSDTGDTPAAQAGEGGSTPTRALQRQDV